MKPSLTSEVVNAVPAAETVHPRGLTIQQAAKYSGLKIWNIRTLIWERRIPYLQTGKHYIVLRDDLDRYLESQRYKVRN